MKEKGDNDIMAQNPVITIEMKNGDLIKAELYPEIAPNTVNNFISLIQKGYYDGVIFHRIINGFMLQGGDPQGTGTGGPGYTIKGEFSQNGFENNLAHDPGVLSMARTMEPDSAGSQFFIMHKKSPHLDGAYAAFGKITEGMDVVNKIADVPTDYNDLGNDGVRNASADVCLGCRGQRQCLGRGRYGWRSSVRYAGIAVYSSGVVCRVSVASRAHSSTTQEESGALRGRVR